VNWLGEGDCLDGTIGETSEFRLAHIIHNESR
jgi:hypothetical protein